MHATIPREWRQRPLWSLVVTDRSVEASWERIERAIRRLGMPAEVLNPPASPAALQALTESVPLPLPVDFLTSLQIHDGAFVSDMTTNVLPFRWLLTAEQLASTWAENVSSSVRHHWVAFDRPSYWAQLIDDGLIAVLGPVKPLGNTTRFWITAYEGAGWFLDFDPAPGGTVAQVCEADPPGGIWVVLARSWADLLTRLADDLEGITSETDPEDAVTRDSWCIDLTQLGAGERPAWLRGVTAAQPDDLGSGDIS